MPRNRPTMGGSKNSKIPIYLVHKGVGKIFPPNTCFQMNYEGFPEKVFGSRKLDFYCILQKTSLKNLPKIFLNDAFTTYFWCFAPEILLLIPKYISRAQLNSRPWRDLALNKINNDWCLGFALLNPPGPNHLTKKKTSIPKNPRNQNNEMISKETQNPTHFDSLLLQYPNWSALSLIETVLWNKFINIRSNSEVYKKNALLS